jgi:ABC-type uncharacterized transport system auxiliary subunit
MSGNRCKWLGLLACAAVLGACGAPRPIKYYGITYPANESVGPDAVDVSLMVRLFEASHLYLDDKIVYCLNGPEMGTYDTHRWADPPVEILQNALVRGLRASGRFRTVYTMRSDASARFVLAGHLYNFDEVDASPMIARLTYEVRLRDRKSGTTVWSHVYSHDEAATEKSVNAFVVAMDKNVHRSIGELQSGLEEYFRNHAPN